jgi:hypothetical protein
MPRSTRGSRPITIDGHMLRWRAGDPSPPNHSTWFAQLTVFSTSGGASRLLAGTWTYDEPAYRYAPHRESDFQPRWVEAIIRKALAAGWDPELRGPNYLLAEDYATIIREFEERLSAKLRESRGIQVPSTP